MNHPERAPRRNWNTIIVLAIAGILVVASVIIFFSRSSATQSTADQTDEAPAVVPTASASSDPGSATAPETDTGLPSVSGAVPSPYVIPTTSGPVNPTPQAAYGVTITPQPLPDGFPNKDQLEASLTQALEAYLLLGPTESPDDWQKRITALAPQLDPRSVQQYHDRLAGLYPLLQAQRQQYQVTISGTVEMDKLNALTDPGGVNMQVPVIVSSTKADGSLLDQPVELWSASYWVNQSGTWVVTSIYFGGGA